MNKQTTRSMLTLEQKLNLIKNTVFTIGDNPNAIGFEMLMDVIANDPSFIFNIVDKGLNVKCPLGFITVDPNNEYQAVEYYVITATEGKHQEEVSYKGLVTGQTFTFQQCAILDHTTTVFDPLQHEYIVSYFNAPSQKKEVEPYTLDNSSIILNIPMYLFDKVTQQKGFIAPGTSLPVDLVEECEMFVTEEERDQAYNKYMDQYNKEYNESKGKAEKFFSILRNITNKGQLGDHGIGYIG